MPPELLREAARTDEPEFVGDVEDSAGMPAAAHRTAGGIQLAGQQVLFWGHAEDGQKAALQRANRHAQLESNGVDPGAIVQLLFEHCARFAYEAALLKCRRFWTAHRVLTAEPGCVGQQIEDLPAKPDGGIFGQHEMGLWPGMVE